MQYSDEVMKHFSNPHNVGEIKNPDGVGEVGNPKCGDMMKITIKVGQRPTSRKSVKSVESVKSKVTQQRHPRPEAEGYPLGSGSTIVDSRLHGNDSEEYIEDVKFLTLGCAAAIASSSMMTDLALGKTLDEALEITKDDINDSLGKLPAQKYHCSILSAEGIHRAIEDYQSKKGKKLHG